VTHNPGQAQEGRAATKRVLWALIIIPPLVFLIIFGPPYAMYVVVSVVAILGLHEFYTLTLPKQALHGKIGGILMGTVLCGVFQWAHYEMVVATMGVIVVVLFVSHILLSQELSTLPNWIATAFFGIVYVPFLLSHVILINKLPQGPLWVLMLSVTVWTGDTFALVAGSRWGKHKLSPHISPKKTVEGFVSCFVGALVSVLAFKLLLLSSLTISDAAVLGLGIALFGQLGDLSESAIKRGANVKDSSRLIPGHGGMLDKLDGFLFSSPFVYYFSVHKIYPGA